MSKFFRTFARNFMDNFVAIDFETANGKKSSICSVGIVIVKDGEIVDNFYSLVKPMPNYYAWFCQEVHGLNYEDTCDAQEFPDVWADAQRKIHEYFPYIEDGEVPFVAHNKAFDENCLKAVFAAYDIAYPDYEFECTLLKSRKVWPKGHHSLDIIAGYCGYDLQNHHHALADAEACAVIAKQIYNETVIIHPAGGSHDGSRVSTTESARGVFLVHE